jgi:ubiquinone/menaquinone biosynthesis C-methylase UbiE
MSQSTVELSPTKYHSEKADIETSSEDYACRFSGAVGEYFLDVQARITLNLLESLPNARILDVGGGHAQLAVPLVKNDYDLTVVGSDDVCRKRLDQLLELESFEYKTCNLLELPFDDNSFDVVISFRLLPHEENWKILVKEMCRVAEKAVIVDYPDIRSFNILYKILFRVKKLFEGNTRTFRSFSRTEVATEFKKNGFVNPRFKAEFFLPMVVHRSVKFVPLLKGIEGFFALLGLRYFFGSPIVLRVLSTKT